MHFYLNLQEENKKTTGSRPLSKKAGKKEPKLPVNIDRSVAWHYQREFEGTLQARGSKKRKDGKVHAASRSKVQTTINKPEEAH